jgi:AAA ATPase domain
MEEPVHGILGRDDELARVKDFLGSVPERPSALRLEGTAGIGKTTLWHAGVAFARALGHRVLSCRAAESEARLSYAALGDLFDFELPDLPAPQKRALDAALLRAEVEGAPPDQRAVSVASLGALRALAASGPVIIAIDDVQWLDAPSARVLAFVVQQELTVYERLGRYVVRDELLAYLAEVECRAGNWDVAARHAQEAYEIDIESGRVLGQGHTLFPKALVAAHQGDMDRARSDAEEGLRQCLRNQDTLDVSCHRAVLGFLELSLRNPAAAIERLEPVLAFLDELGSPEPASSRACRTRSRPWSPWEG